jgi:type IV pilus assembly protein PilV
MTPQRRRLQAGFSMIEMLVGLLIISFGLLGLINMQARALQSAVGTEDSQRAALLANEMAATMFNLNTLDINPTTVEAWAARVSDTSTVGVPNGTGTVTMLDAHTARITVTWTPPNSTGAANDTHTYSTDVVIAQ